MATQYKTAASDKKKEAQKLMSNAQLTQCNIAIHTASAACGVAGAIPIPVADAVPITAAQISMVLALGKIFNQKISQAAAKGLISVVASTFVGRNLVKLIPVLGWGISAAVAAGITEAVGWTVAVDFAKNAQKECNSEIQSDELSSNETTTSADDSKRAENDEIVTPESLEKRGKVFLNAEKKLPESFDEYNILILDLEKYIDDHDIDEHHPLRKMYDDLCVLGV